MNAESLAKAYILTHGVRFTQDALGFAAQVNAKRQNGVYNLPAADKTILSVQHENLALSALPSEGRLDRPQEMFLKGEDGYTVCVSAVAPVLGREPATVNFIGGRLTLATPSRSGIGLTLDELAFVPQPRYYDRHTASGRSVKRWVSACGYDEMNIWPWHDCAISRTCTFCGINAVQKQAGQDVDLIHALEMRREPDADRAWLSVREQVVSEIVEAVGLAIDDDCYRDEIHLILISGNLADHQLDRIARDGTGHIHFGWAGGEHVGDPHYYRLQGPWFLVEYDNTQNGANHIHTVWRDFDAEWGDDLLANHYAERRHGDHSDHAHGEHGTHGHGPEDHADHSHDVDDHAGHKH